MTLSNYLGNTCNLAHDVMIITRNVASLSEGRSVCYDSDIDHHFAAAPLSVKQTHQQTWAW